MVGGVERTPARRVFMCTVRRRDASTLLQIIRRHVRPGSIIHTDCWAAYNEICNQEGYQFAHRTVNHEESYVALDGTHTNTIEGKAKYTVKSITF